MQLDVDMQVDFDWRWRLLAFIYFTPGGSKAASPGWTREMRLSHSRWSGSFSHASQILMLVQFHAVRVEPV